MIGAISEKVWRAMRSGMTSPQTSRDWQAFSDGACRTAIDVVREQVQERLAREYSALLITQITTERKMRAYETTMAAVRYSAHGWEERCRALFEGQS
jgi:hypothetical protein